MIKQSLPTDWAYYKLRGTIYDSKINHQLLSALILGDKM
jgi:hypothetical protein